MKGLKTGGRRKGTPNKATAEIKAASQLHGDELVDGLLALTTSDDERVRLGAIQACLDRGWGRPAQSVDLGVEVQITAIERTIVYPRARGRRGGGRVRSDRRGRICTSMSAQIVVFRNSVKEVPITCFCSAI